MSASWGQARFTPRGSGDGAWVELMDADFSTEADQSPASSQLVFGGITWTVEGGANDTAGGPKILSGALVISPDIATNVARSSTGKRSAPILRSTLSNLGAAFSALGTRQLLVNVEIAAFSPAATQEAFRVGLESSAAPLGSGASGRGVSGGTAYQTNQRAGSIVWQDSAGTGNTDATATLAIRSLACLYVGASVAVYSSATPGALDSPEKVLAATPQIVGGMRGSSTLPTLDRLMLVGESPDASAGPVITISAIRIWARE
jgi:hypothetical protein